MAFTLTKTSRNSFELQAPGETTLMQTAQTKRGRLDQNFSSEAWLYRGTGNILGELKREDGRLSYKLERDAHQPECVVFDARITDVEAEFPWYYCGGGFKIRVGGAKYVFGLAKLFIPKGGIVGKIQDVFLIPKLIKMIRHHNAWKKALREQIR